MRRVLAAVAAVALLTGCGDASTPRGTSADGSAQSGQPERSTTYTTQVTVGGTPIWCVVVEGNAATGTSVPVAISCDLARQ